MKNTLAVLALCAAPLLAQASNCTGDNADAEYILGEAEGEASAMHWPTGLVWKRCVEGMSYSSGQCTGTPASGEWQNWATSYLPKYFADSGSYPHSAPNTQNLLASGAWRMAYRGELVKITENCDNNPKINRTVFPNTPRSYVWSGSPDAYHADNAWGVYFYSGYAGYWSRSRSDHVRLVRAGQSFASLNASPITQNAAAGTAAVGFTTTITLASAADTTAWGGVRFQNGSSGNPQLQVNSGAWVTEAIVKTGDIIAVRMDAPASGSHTATLEVRSGQTTGTTSIRPGAEFTEPKQTTATFTLNTPENGTCGSAHTTEAGAPLLADVPTANLCNAGAASPVTGGDEKWSWTCDGRYGGTGESCEAPRGYTVTPTVQGMGGSISPAAPQTVAYGATPAFTLTPNAHHASAASGCGGSLSGSQFTTAPVAAHCTVNATFTPIPGQCGAAHGGTFATAPSANLCDAGTPSPVTRGVAWTWSCTATTTASCNAVTAYVITATPEPSYAGTVSCTPNPVPRGASTTCSATPRAGYEFALWDMVESCDGSTASTCRLDGVTGEDFLTARFTIKTYTISASVEPPGAGRVICPLGPLPHGVSATCQALAGAYPLAGWQGCSQASGSVCELNGISAAPTVVARFDTSRVTVRPLNDTGVPFSGGAVSGNASTCDGPGGQDCHHGRDAGAATGQLASEGASSDARNGFDFTKVSSSGAALPAGATLDDGWACTRDNTTGLVWEVKTTSGGMREASFTYTWHDPHSPDGQPGTSDGGVCGPYTPSCDTAGFVHNMNLNGLCGAHDWRVPTVEELAGLLDLGRAAPAARIDPGYFPHGAAAGYWTRTPFAGDTSQAWQVDFASGAARPAPRGDALRVRLVRGGP